MCVPVLYENSYSDAKYCTYPSDRHLTAGSAAFGLNDRPSARSGWRAITASHVTGLAPLLDLAGTGWEAMDHPEMYRTIPQEWMIDGDR